MEPRLDGPLGQARDGHDVSVAHSLDVAQDQQLAKVRVDGRQGPLNQGLRLVACQDFVGPRHGLADGESTGDTPQQLTLGHVVHGLGAAVPASPQVLEPILAKVDRDSVEPRGQAAVAPEGVDRQETAHEDVLGDILGFDGVPDHSQAQVEDGPLVPHHELVESELLAPLQALDESVFFGGGHRCVHAVGHP